MPCQILLTQCPETFFGVQNASFCVQKASLSVRTGRVRMKIHSVPFFESSSLKTRFSSKSAKILDSKTQKKAVFGDSRYIYTHAYVCFSLWGAYQPDQPLVLVAHDAFKQVTLPANRRDLRGLAWPRKKYQKTHQPVIPSTSMMISERYPSINPFACDSGTGRWDAFSRPHHSARDSQGVCFSNDPFKQCLLLHPLKLPSRGSKAGCSSISLPVAHAVFNFFVRVFLSTKTKLALAESMFQLKSIKQLFCFNPTPLLWFAPEPRPV